MDAPTLFDTPAPAGPVAPRPPASAAAPRRRPSQQRTGPLLLAVDGNSLAHRAFHAYGPASATYGFLALLAAVGERTAPDALVVGFDCRAASVRRERWPAYKAGRAEKDPALDRLLDALPALLVELGVVVVQPRGLEADDVLGSAAAAAEAAGWRCALATSDRDAFALVSDRTTVLRLRNGLDNLVEVTPARLRRDLGVRPEQYVELAALRGDTSDNLPGITGIGPATAGALLRAFGDVASAVADPIELRSVIGRPAGQALLDDVADPGRSVFLRNVELMTIRRDLVVDPDACRPVETPERLAGLLAARGLGAVAGRLPALLAVRPEIPPPPDDGDAPW